MERCVEYWEFALKEIERRLARNDGTMVRRYASRSDLAGRDVRHSFRPGDHVLVNRKIVGKTKARCIGPFVFQRYVGDRGVNAELRGVGGRVRVESVANLIPMQPRLPAAAPLEPWDFDSSSTSGSLIEEAAPIARLLFNARLV